MEKAIKRYWPVFVVPTLAAFLIGFVWPFLQGLYLSFCKFITVDNAQWNGVKNYMYALTEADFLHSFWFTALFTVVSTICINAAAFAIALALTRGIKGTNVFRSVFFMPNLIGGIVLGYIWNILLNCLLTCLLYTSNAVSIHRYSVSSFGRACKPVFCVGQVLRTQDRPFSVCKYKSCNYSRKVVHL